MRLTYSRDPSKVWWTKKAFWTLSYPTSELWDHMFQMFTKKLSSTNHIEHVDMLAIAIFNLFLPMVGSEEKGRGKEIACGSAPSCLFVGSCAVPSAMSHLYPFYSLFLPWDVPLNVVLQFVTLALPSLEGLGPLWVWRCFENAWGEHEKNEAENCSSTSG